MPIHSEIDPLTFRSYRFLNRTGVGGWHHFDMVGFPVETARNEITWAVLADAPDVTHLFWVDSDMIFGPDALTRLLAHDLDFVGGLCFDRRHPYKPVISRYFDPSWGFDPKTHGWLFDYPQDQVIDVDATGGAFLLVKRRVFEKIRETEGKGDPAWRKWWERKPGTGLSEDLSFCERVQEAGFKIRVDTGIDIGHKGEVVVNKDFVARNRQFEYGQWHPVPNTVKEVQRGSRTALEDACWSGPVTETGKRLAEDKPLASIVIPTYNTKAEWLQGAVQSALAQTVPVEVIVVDDGTMEYLIADADDKDAGGARRAMQGAVSIVRMPRGVRILHHDGNKGIAAALNTGISAMSTDWFCWLPADDLFEPDKVALQLASLMSVRGRCGYHGFTLKTDNGNRIAHVRTPVWNTREEQNRVLAQVCAINGTTVMIHRSVFDRVGRFDESYKYGQDWEFWCRAGLEFDWHGMTDKLATRREFQNLTEALAKDKARKADRDAEDTRIREKYKVRDRVAEALAALKESGRSRDVFNAMDEAIRILEGR